MPELIKDPSAEQFRFITMTMSDGSVMKVAIDEEGSAPAHVRKIAGGNQISSLKTLRNSVRLILNQEHDDVALNILMYIINNEPVSVYRVAKTVPYNFSLTYKKANKLRREGLIRQIDVNGTHDHRSRHLFESTVKGLLTGWNLGYMEDHEMLESLSKKWNIKVEDLKRLDRVFKLLPNVASDRDTAVFQDLSVLAAAVTAYENCKSNPKNNISPEEESQGEECAMRYVLASALKKVSRGRMVVFASKDYTMGYEPYWKKTFVYNCTLCNRGCSMTEVSPHSSKCIISNALFSSFSPRAPTRSTATSLDIGQDCSLLTSLFTKL